MSYADDLYDLTPAPQREGFTNSKHWRVVQTAPEGHGTTNWFASRSEAATFAAHLGFDVRIEGVSCEEFESAWPEDWREPHMHGSGSENGERQEEPLPRSDARRSQRLGRLI
jgi:hypothetical protein